VSAPASSFKQAHNPPAAPPALGPYSHVVRSGALVFCSGQVPIDPAHPGGPLPAGVAAQTRRVLENVKLLLASQGLGFEHVVKTTVFLTDLAEFQALNAVYAEYFPAPYPARSTVQVVALPRGAAVEIEVTAAMP
jgi:2-iminobutanoate/2-iminopropanoate deaminase